MLKVGLLVEDNKRRDGDPPVFAQAVIWGEMAEQLADRLPKGASVYIEGKCKLSAWAAQDGTPRARLDVSAWKAEPMGQIGRQAPRRRNGDGEPVRLGAGSAPRRMPEAVAVGGRNTRAQLGLDDDLEGWAE